MQNLLTHIQEHLHDDKLGNAIVALGEYIGLLPQTELPQEILNDYPHLLDQWNNFRSKELQGLLNNKEALHEEDELKTKLKRLLNQLQA